MDNKKKHTGLWIIALILFVASIFIMIMSYNGGIKLVQNNNAVVEYDSIAQLKRATKLDLRFPSIVNEKDNIEIRVTSGTFVEIGCDKYVVKAASYVDNMADTLALYDNIPDDNYYIVNNNDITFFRFRLGYPNLSNCTIINWVSGDVAYGMILSSVIDEDEALEILGIDKGNIVEYNRDNVSTDKNNENSTDSELVEVILNEKISMQLPKFSGQLTKIDGNGRTLLSLDNQMFAVVIYDNFDENIIEIEDEIEIITSSGVIIKYPNENPFAQDSKSYADYNLFIDTIDDISNSMRYID